jgi:hypothetical protein
MEVKLNFNEFLINEEYKKCVSSENGENFVKPVINFKNETKIFSEVISCGKEYSFSKNV